MKDKTLKFKVTSEEKRKIEQDAENYGSTTSDYIRHKMLEKDSTSTDGKRTQKIVECLCEFSCISEKISDENLREKLKKVEVMMWQHLR